MSRTYRKYLLITLAAVTLIGCGMFAAFLFKNDALCIARIGVTPDEQHFTDAATFHEQVTAIESDALSSLVRKFDEDTGLFAYSLHPNGSVSSANNDIRQLLASRILALESAHDEHVHVLHQQNLTTIMETWYREEGNDGYVYVDEKSKLGANAMLLRVLVASPSFADYRAEAAALARGIISLQQNDGSFVPWYVEPSYEYNADYLLTFYSGEAILALLEYAEHTGDQQAYHAAVRAQDLYINEYVMDIEENYYPAYVPWHTQSLAHLYKRTGDRRYADAIFVLNDKVLELQDTERFVGRFYDPETPQYGSPHGSSDAVYTEGLAYAYEVAKAAGDEKRAERYYNALVYGVHNLAYLQYEPKWWEVYDDNAAQERLQGGIMTNACSRWVRIDTTAHTIDALAHLGTVLSQ